jgi:hypothetical protein
MRSPSPTDVLQQNCIRSKLFVYILVYRDMMIKTVSVNAPFWSISLSCYYYIFCTKAKVVPPRHEGAWGERRYSSYSFSISALDGGEWSASPPGRALPPGKGPPVPIVQEAGWAPEPVWTQILEEKSFRLCRGSNLVQSVARHYTESPCMTQDWQIVWDSGPW